MAGCGCGDDIKFDGVSTAYRRVLWIVIAINAAMFVVEMVAGQLAGSQALQADALDFLGGTCFVRASCVSTLHGSCVSSCHSAK